MPRVSSAKQTARGLSTPFSPSHWTARLFRDSLGLGDDPERFEHIKRVLREIGQKYFDRDVSPHRQNTLTWRNIEDEAATTLDIRFRTDPEIVAHLHTYLDHHFTPEWRKRIRRRKSGDGPSGIDDDPSGIDDDPRGIDDPLPPRPPTPLEDAEDPGNYFIHYPEYLLKIDCRPKYSLIPVLEPVRRANVRHLKALSLARHALLKRPRSRSSSPDPRPRSPMYATRSEHHTTYQYVDFDYCGANALQVAADTLSLPAPKRELSVVELSLGLSRDDMLDILQAETSQGDASEPLQDDVPEPLQDDVLELSYDDMPEPLQDDVLSQEDIDSAQNTTATPPIDFDSQRTLVDADINASEQDRTLPSGSSKSYPEKTTWTPELSEAIPYISRYGRRVKSATKEPAEVTSRAEAGRSSQKRKRNEKENDGPSSEVSTREPLTDPKTRPRPRPRYRQWNDDSSQGTPLLGPRQSYQAAPPVNPHSFASSSLSTYEERELVDSSDEGTQYHDHSDHAPSPHLRASSTLPTYKERDLDDPFDEGTQDHDQSDEPNPYSRASSIVSILVPLNDADSFNDGTPAPESFDEGTSRHYNDDTPNYQLRASSILSMGVPYNDKNPFYGGSPVPEHPGIGQFDQIPQASEPPCPIRDFLANIGRPQLRPALLDAGVRTATDLRGLARMDACELKGMLERWREGWVFTDGGEVEAVFTGLQRLKTVGA